MTAKVHESSRVVIDLASVPYFPAQREPLTLQEASGLERVRETVPDLGSSSDYLVDRQPQPTEDTLFFGGIGLASVMDVHAHPIRTQLHRINVMTVFAISAVAAVAIVMLTLVTALKP